MSNFRRLYSDFVELLVPPKWRFKCTECRDTGWCSYNDRIGTKTYHNLDHCRKCRRLGRAVMKDTGT